MRLPIRSSALLLAACAPMAAQFHLPGSGGGSAPKPAAPQADKPAQAAPREAPQPVAADYYVLSLTWRDNRVFVAALAPRMNSGPSPESCGTPKPANKGAVKLAAPLMRDEAAIQAEWKKHGSCTGLKAPEYFNMIRYVRSLVQIPVQITSPEEDAATETPKLAAAQFASANPDFPAGSIEPGDGEVRICFSAADLKPQPCAIATK